MTQQDEESGGYRGPTPPPDEAPTRSARHWIDRPVDLVAMSRLLSQAPVLAVDAEFVAARITDPTQVPRLALIQIADDQRCFVVDAQKLTDLSPLDSVMRHPAVLKIFHGVGSDLRVLRSRDLLVRHLLDLEAVSRAIFGQRESGLQAMLQRACGVRMDKTLQRSDWTQRPLPTAMYMYAARDAEMTFALYEWLRKHYLSATANYMERADDPAPEMLVAPWLAAFVQGERSFPQDLVNEMTEEVLTHDCLAALEIISRPPWRARIFRAAADLVLQDIAPGAIQALGAWSAEERAAAARALGRLRVKSALGQLTATLDDPVHDVRKAAAVALEQLDLPPRPHRFTRALQAEPIAESGPTEESDAPWKSLLRDFFDKPES